MPEELSARRSLRVGLTQLRPGQDVAENLAQVLGVIHAAGPHVDVVVLPENCLVIGTNEEMRAGAVALDGPEIDAVREAAAVVGSVVILGGVKRYLVDGRIANTAIVVAADGRIAGTYDKIHLFDARVAGREYAASSVETPGDHPVLLDLAEVRFGLSICFDLRFPELYRVLAGHGADVLLVPAAFTVQTGGAHWDVLLRARAIENGAYVVASATVGSEQVSSFPTYGHAMVVDPWGGVLADLGEDAPAWRAVELDLGRVERARTALPVLGATRPAAYSAAVEVVDAAASVGAEEQSA